MRNMLFALLILLPGCSTMHIKEQTLEQFMSDANIENVDEIAILSGATGEQKTLTDDQIAAFIDETKDVLFTADDN